MDHRYIGTLPLTLLLRYTPTTNAQMYKHTNEYKYIEKSPHRHTHTRTNTIFPLSSTNTYTFQVEITHINMQYDSSNHIKHTYIHMHKTLTHTHLHTLTFFCRPPPCVYIFFNIFSFFILVKLSWSTSIAQSNGRSKTGWFEFFYCRVFRCLQGWVYFCINCET